jgi:iron complex outermembrane receptor protein
MVLQERICWYRFKCDPSFCNRQIEVLRDGASAQYGSDAIAGVININVKKATNKFDIALFSGSFFFKKEQMIVRGGNDGTMLRQT